MFRQACFLVTIFCAACCMAGKNHNHKTHTTYSNRSLSRIPSNLSVTRTSLAFDHNHIRNITNNTFVGSKQLTSLTIAFNNLSLIEANAFRGLTHLSRLNLDYNKITTVENYFVPDLGNLTYLDLAGNDIRIISQHALDHLLKLKVLILGKNSISSIHKHAFTKLTKLQILDLQSNELTVPSQYWFTFSKLTTLNFKANNWICDCHVLKYQRWLMKQSRTHNNLYDIQCQEPQRVSGHKLSTIHSSGLSCPPATVSVPHHEQTTTTHAHPHVASTTATTTTHRTHTLAKTHAHPHVAATTTTTTTTVATTTKSTTVKPHHVENHTYLKGSSITLQCSSTMFPDSNWFHKKKQYTKGVIGTNNSLTLKGLTSSSSGLYCCKRDSHNLSCHKLVMQQHKEHHTSPVVYVIVVFFVLLVVFGAGFCFWKRIRKARRESYGLLSDQHAFHPSVDGLSHNNDPRTAL